MNLLTSRLTRLPQLPRDCNPRDISNAGEIGLFYKLLANRSLVLRGDSWHGGNGSRDRLAVLPGANVTGAEKLPALVMGEAGNRRCLEGVKPCPPALIVVMTSALFTNSVQEQDRKCKAPKRKLVIVIDNCPADPHVDGLRAVKLLFLSPNTTSRTQPMDQGNTANLKHH